MRVISLPQFGMTARIVNENQIEIYDCQNSVDEPVTTLELADAKAIVEAFEPSVNKKVLNEIETMKCLSCKKTFLLGNKCECRNSCIVPTKKK